MIKDTPTIFKAVGDGDFEEVSRILTNNSDLVNETNSSSLTPLHLAVKACNKEIAEFLIFYGADVNARLSNGGTALHLAASCDDQAETVTLLAANGAEVNIVNNDNITPLHTAATLGAKHAVKILILAGAEVNVTDKDGKTPLDRAIKNGYKKIAKILRKRSKKYGNGVVRTP